MPNSPVWSLVRWPCRALIPPPDAAGGAPSDVLIAGAAPARLATAVYGASEGLTTVSVDAVAAGGQAATSSRIENHLGFPTGISGAEVAERALLQATRFGARTGSAWLLGTLGLDRSGFVRTGADAHAVADREESAVAR